MLSWQCLQYEASTVGTREADMKKPVLKKVEGNGVGIQLAMWQGVGKPVLCIHGLTANCRNWDVIADALTPGHFVMAMDLRGRGRSDRPSSGYDIEHHCRDIESLLAELKIPSCALMGHSLGAIIALAYAAGHPEQVEGIVLIDGGGELSEEQKNKVLAGIQHSLDRLGKVFPSFEAYREHMQSTPLLQPWSPAMDNFLAHDLERAPEGVSSSIRLEAIQEELVNLARLDIGSLYPQVQCPALILRAREGMEAHDDILLPQDVLDRMLREIPRVQHMDMEKGNHYTIMFQKDGRRDQAIHELLSQSFKAP